MAERRMFAKSVINSARFLTMPPSSRLLYYDLGMAADDDGVVEAFTVMRMTGAADDDLRVLVSKGFVSLLNDELVAYITDWSTNNQIRKDRYQPSIYRNLLVKLGDGNQWLTDGLPDGNQRSTQYRLGKDRLGKDRLEIDNRSSSLRSEDLVAPEAAATPKQEESEHIPYAKVQKLYNDLCPKMAKCTVMSEARKKAIKARFRSGYELEDFERLFTLAAQSTFLNGGNKRNFMANFDWLIRDANMAKVLDGNYADRAGGNNSPDGVGFTYDYGDMSGSL